MAFSQTNKQTKHFLESNNNVSWLLNYTTQQKDSRWENYLDIPKQGTLTYAQLSKIAGRISEHKSKIAIWEQPETPLQPNGRKATTAGAKPHKKSDSHSGKAVLNRDEIYVEGIEARLPPDVREMESYTQTNPDSTSAYTHTHTQTIFFFSLISGM